MCDMHTNGIVQYSDCRCSCLPSLQAEKRRYRNSGDDLGAKSTDSSSRPPRPPANSRSTSNTSLPSAASGARGTADGDGGFVNDDWDESFEDSPVKPSKGKKHPHHHADVVTGSRPDSNWLDEDFDD